MKRLHPRRWMKVLFFIITGLLLLPPIVTFALTQFNLASGCSLDGNAMGNCQTIGQSIQRALQINQNQFWLYFQFLGLPIWGMTFLAFKGFRGSFRWFAGLSAIWILPHSPIIMGAIAAATLHHDDCTVVDCVVFNVNMTSEIAAFQVMPWLMMISVPMCSVATVVFASLLVRASSKRMNSPEA